MIVDDLKSPINLNVSDNFETIRQKCRFSRRTKTASEFHLWAYWTWWWRSRYIRIGKKKWCWWRISATKILVTDWPPTFKTSQNFHSKLSPISIFTDTNKSILGCTFEWNFQWYDWNASKRRSRCHLSRYSDYLRKWYKTKSNQTKKLSEKINRFANLPLTVGRVVNQRSFNILEIGLNLGQNILVVTFSPI